MMMMKLGGELHAARPRLGRLAAKSNRITCRPALVAGTCTLAARPCSYRVQHLLGQSASLIPV